MLVPNLQALGAFPSVEMDRQGVSGNIENQSEGGQGFEQSLMAMLFGPIALQNPQGAQTAVDTIVDQPLPDSQAANPFIALQGKKAELDLQNQLPAASKDQAVLASKGEAGKLSELALMKPEQVVSNMNELKAKLNSVKNPEPLTTQASTEAVSEMNKSEMPKVKVSEQNMDMNPDMQTPETEQAVWNLRKEGVTEEALSRGLENQVKLEPKLERPMGIKNLADSLYIQRHLGSESQFSLTELKAEVPKEAGLGQQVRANLVQDMQAFISRMVETKDGGSISLKLRPGNMGEVQVKVDVQSEMVKIQMNSDSPMAESLLKSQSSELKQQLQGVGLKIDDIQFGSTRNPEAFQDSKDHKGSQQQSSQQQHQQEKQDQKQLFDMDEFSFSELVMEA